MTKVYDALKRADALRKGRGNSDKATAEESLAWDPKLRASEEKADATNGSNGVGGDLGKLREIVFGDLLNGQEQELKRLDTRIATEASKIREELLQLGRRIDDRIAEIDTRYVKEQGDLREQILAQSKRLNESIQEQSTKTDKLIHDGLAELRQSTVDSATFSGFLRDLAERVDAKAKLAPVKDGDGKVSA